MAASRQVKNALSVAPTLFVLLLAACAVLAMPKPDAYSDQSIRGYLTERTCWSNEICKEEFQAQFRCKCPLWSFCRSPGRYYNAYCTITATGYIWSQPDKGTRTTTTNTQ